MKLMMNNTEINTLSFGETIGNTYSLEEQRIGTWVDDKPLYRQVILTKTPSNGGNQIVHSLSTLPIENIINIYGTISLTAYIVPFNIYNGSYTASLFYDKSGVLLTNISKSEYLGKPCIIIFEYTKTTN